jgi:hypothetical protein
MVETENLELRALMENLRIRLALKDDSDSVMRFANGKELIQRLYGNDFGAPPKFLSIEAKLDDRRTVFITVGDDADPLAHVAIEED